MPTMIYNAKKQFWHPATRTFQTEPVEIDDVQWKIEYPMAARSDDTTDVMHYTKNMMAKARSIIEHIKVDDEYIATMRKMNNEYLHEGI